jgi:cell division protein ZipA
VSDWLSILIVILIVGIVLDGLRRARNSRRGEIRLSPNARKVDQYFEQETNSELASEFPNGGARPKAGEDLTHQEQAPVEESDIVEKEPAPAPKKPVQASLDLDDPVPMLMDTIDGDEMSDTVENDPEVSQALVDELEPSLGSLEALDVIEEKPPTEQVSAGASKLSASGKGKHENESIFQRARSVVEEHIQAQLNEPSKAEPSSKDAAPEPGPQEILVVNIMAPSGTAISGASLRHAFNTQGLKFGEMGIFHRHLNNDGDAGVVFSIANIVEPGSFDFADMENMQTPGISLFLSLPTVCSAVDAYSDLVDTARAIASEVGGELKDENRSTFTNQTVEHGRQRAIEFERKTKLVSR